MELGLYPGSYECSILENVNVQKAGDEGTNDNQQVEESTTGHHSTCAGHASRKATVLVRVVPLVRPQYLCGSCLS